MERRTAERGTWGYSDDTEMAIGLAESLVHCGRFDPGDALARLAANFWAALHHDPKSFDPESLFSGIVKEVPEVGGWFGARISLVVSLLRGNPSESDLVEQLGNGVTAGDAVPLALYSFCRWHSDPMRCVVNSVRCGAWLENLENGPKGRDYVIGLADALYESAAAPR